LSGTATVILGSVVSISPTTATVATGAFQQFTATVTGTTQTGVTWSVSGSGCSGSSCGTVSASGFYTAPGSLPNPATVTVKATSVATGQSASATVTINSPIVVSVSPKTVELVVGAQQQFTATVTGTSTTGVNWSVSGKGCSGTACGTIGSTGLYTAPSTAPAPAQVSVTATSTANSSISASATVTILASNNAKLNGSYAYMLKGFDSNGVFQEAGSIQADGNGNIVSGLEDVNNTNGVSTQLAVTGAYQVTADNRGTLTLVDSLATHTFTFALNGKLKIGRMVSADKTGLRVSGVILLQDPTAFDASVLANGYVLSLSGMNTSGQRIGALGLIFPDGSSFVAGDSMDVNEGGNVNPTYSSWSGTYSVDDSTGRGTMTWGVPGFDGGLFDFAVYVVSANQFLLLSIDPFSDGNPIFGGAAYVQNGAPYTAASFDGGSAFETAAVDVVSSEATVGGLAFDGVSSVVMTYDQNQGGTVTVDNVMTGAYSVELNGRGSMTLINPNNGQTRLWDMYTIAPGQALMLDVSTDSAATGEMLQQVAGSYSNENIYGAYLVGTEEVVDPADTLQSGEMSFDGGNSKSGTGNVSGTEDINSVSGLSSNAVVSGTYSLSTVSDNGRGSIMLSKPATDTLSVWYASSTEFFALDLSKSDTHPVVLHFEQ
jgi:hypothetical protein